MQTLSCWFRGSWCLLTSVTMATPLSVHADDSSLIEFKSHWIQSQNEPESQAGPAPEDPNADELAWADAMRQGQEALQQGNVNRAIRSFENAADIAESSLTDARRLAISVSVLGDLYLSQNNVGNAEAAFRRAVEALSQAFGPDHRAAGEPSMKLGRALLMQDRPEEAREALEKAIACLADTGQRTVRGRANARAGILAMSHLLLMQALSDLDAYEDLGEASDRAVEHLTGTIDDAYPFWGSIHNLRGYGYSVLAEDDPAQYAKAAEAFRLSVQWHNDHATPDDGGTTEALLGLARAAHGAGERDDAIDAYLQAIDRLKAANDEDGTVRLAYTWAGLSSVYHDQHQRIDAIDAMYKSVDTAARQDDPAPINRLTAMLGADLRQADLAEDAVATLQSQLDAAPEFKPGTEPTRGLVLAELGRALAHRGLSDDLEQAESVLAEAANQLDGAGEDFAFSAAWTRVAQAGLLIDTGRFEEAITLISAAIQTAKERGDKTGREIAVAMQPILITAHLLAGQTDTAVRQARQRLKQVGRIYGERSPDTAQARAHLANALADSGDQQAALATYEQALALLEPLGATADGDRSWIQFSYARELFNDGQYEKALPIVQEAFATDPQDYIAFYVACCQLRLGQAEAAKQTLADWAEARHPEPGVDWPAQVLAMLRGEKTSDELAQIARQQGGYTQTRWLCEMYFYLAIKTIAEGHDRAAIKYLKACRNQNVYQFVEWESAHRMLTRLEKP